MCIFYSSNGCITIFIHRTIGNFEAKQKLPNVTERIVKDWRYSNKFGVIGSGFLHFLYLLLVYYPYSNEKAADFIIIV